MNEEPRHAPDTADEGPGLPRTQPRADPKPPPEVTAEIENAILRLGEQHVKDLQRLQRELHRQALEAEQEEPPGPPASEYGGPPKVGEQAGGAAARPGRSRLWLLLAGFGILLAALVALLIYVVDPGMASNALGIGAGAPTAPQTAVPSGAGPTAPAATTPAGAAQPTPGTSGVAGTPPAGGTGAPSTDAAALMQRLGAAVANLQTGKVYVIEQYGDGSEADSTLEFDLAASGGEPRLHLLATYRSAAGTQQLERVVIGNRAWQRQADGSWAPVTEEEGVWGRLQPFVPDTGAAQDVSVDTSTGATLLRWHDSSTGNDVTANVNPATGIPSDLRQTSRQTGVTRIVTFLGWNTPVEITPPAA